MAAPGGQLAFIAHGNGGVLDQQLTKVQPFLRTLLNELQSHKQRALDRVELKLAQAYAQVVIRHQVGGAQA